MNLNTVNSETILKDEKFLIFMNNSGSVITEFFNQKENGYFKINLEQ